MSETGTKRQVNARILVEEGDLYSIVLTPKDGQFSDAERNNQELVDRLMAILPEVPGGVGSSVNEIEVGFCFDPASGQSSNFAEIVEVLLTAFDFTVPALPTRR